VKNSDRFLVAFNAIEHALKEHSEDDSYVPFSRQIQIAKKTNAVIRRYYDDLKEFSELRNAIVHNTIDLNYAIAEPHLSVVEQIEYIEQEIKKPQKVIPLFARNVTSFSSHDTLKEILLAINKFSYSKFPIYDNDRFLGLLTKKGIVNWLAKNASQLEAISFSSTLIKEVLLHEEKQKNYQFIHKKRTIYDIKEIFKSINPEDSPRIDALLITEHGRADEQLLGIITPWDLINTP